VLEWAASTLTRGRGVGATDALMRGGGGWRNGFKDRALVRPPKRW